jgi:hypothetical protein
MECLSSFFLSSLSEESKLPVESVFSPSTFILCLLSLKDRRTWKCKYKNYKIVRMPCAYITCLI